MLRVEKTSGETYQVTVSRPPETVHAVALDDEYYQKLTGGGETPERLIERSFEFLLRREPNTAILRRFALPEIGRYFPEYEREIGGGTGRS